MIRVENIEVWGFQHAVRGMRNPLQSHSKSDSYFRSETSWGIGKNDLDLMRRLYKAGTEHRKYLRQIFVSMDITAPLYWWKEFDTYKVGTTANSYSTMHKIQAKEFTLDEFSLEHLSDDHYLEVCVTSEECYAYVTARDVLIYTISALNSAREEYLKTKDKKYWWYMIQLLPSSYNQKRTITMNYENVVSMIHQRTGHKLDEWNAFVEVLKGLPYIKEIMEG